MSCLRKGNRVRRPGSESTARRIAESKIASVETEIRLEFKPEIDSRVEREIITTADKGEAF
jgi:hypothetical protein